MPTYCAASALPSFKDLTALFAPLGDFTVPDLPTFGNDSNGMVHNFGMKISSWVQEFQKFNLVSAISAIISPLASILGGAIDDLLPKVPGLGMGFTAFITATSHDIYAAVASALEDTGNAIWALLPSPIFSGLTNKALEMVEIVKTVLVSYLTSLVNKVIDLCNAAAVILGVPGIGVTPTIPALADIEIAVKDYMVAHGKTVIESIEALFPVIPSPLFPTPFFSGVSSLGLEFRHMMNVLMTNFIILPFQMVVDFAHDALGVTLAGLCITI